MKNRNFRQIWLSFLHWKGWKAAGAACAKAWRACCAWPGWKRIFCLPFWLTVLLSAACAGGLVWVFAARRELWIGAYVLYALSAYCLTAVCVQLPVAIRQEKSWISRHPDVEGLLKDEELQFRLGLYGEQLINFAYGIFKTASGVILGSAWIGCDGIYNLVLALIQLFQILRRKAGGSLWQQWKAYRFCGVLILLLHLSLTGIVFQMVNWNRAEEQGQIQVIATATFAFYKVISAFISIARDRKHLHPVDSSVRMLNLAQAIFAIFVLQASMFHAYGTGAAWEQGMNLITGCTVCLLIVSTGIYMIRRGTREIKHLQERNDGE